VGNSWGSKAPVDIRVQAALQEGAACAADAATVATGSAAAASLSVAVDASTGSMTTTGTASRDGGSSGGADGEQRNAEWWYQLGLEIAVDAEAGTTALSTITAGAVSNKGSKSSSSGSSSSGRVYRGLTGLCLEKLAPALLVQVHAGTREASSVAKMCRLVQKHVPAEPLASFYLGAALRQQALHVPRQRVAGHSGSSSKSSSSSGNGLSTSSIGISGSTISGFDRSHNDERMRLLRESAEAYIEAATRSEALHRAARLTQDAAIATAMESAAAAAKATSDRNHMLAKGDSTISDTRSGAATGTTPAAAVVEYASVSARVATAAVESTAQHLERWLRHSGLAGVALGEANEAASGEILLEVCIR